jgi:hypothetical protein
MHSRFDLDIKYLQGLSLEYQQLVLLGEVNQMLVFL